MEQMDSPKTTLTFRIPVDLYEWVRRLAKQEGRSVSQTILRMVQAAKKRASRLQ